jgi:hypothetical protein
MYMGRKIKEIKSDPEEQFTAEVLPYICARKDKYDQNQVYMPRECG